MKRFGLAAALAFGCAVAQAASASAWLIRIDDSTDTMWTYVYQDGVLSQPPGNCGTGENCSQAAGFYLTPTDQAANLSLAFNVYEPDGKTLSDFGTASAFFQPNGGLQDFALSLNSDFDGVPLVGPPASLNLIETGGWQTVTTANVYDASGAVIDTITWQFRSEVPEPLTLSLFGAGLAGAAVMRRRRARKRA